MFAYSMIACNLMGRVAHVQDLYTREYQQMLALLRAKRTAAEVSQVELARRLDWTQADVSKCETGVRRLDVIELRLWLSALGCELADFVRELDNSVALLPIRRRWSGRCCGLRLSNTPHIAKGLFKQPAKLSRTSLLGRQAWAAIRPS